MTINGWDIKNANARQWNVTPDFLSTSNDSEWVKGSILPDICGNDTGFKTLKIVFVVEGNGNRQEILNNCSNLLSHFLEPAEIVLDGFEHKYYGVMTKHNHDEKAMHQWHKLTVEFECYEYAEEVAYSFSGAQEFTVKNTGNIKTPIIMEITPKISAASIVVSGICRNPDTLEDLPVTIKELQTGKTVILNGENGIISQDNELKQEVEIWELPSLLPGDNVISVNQSGMDITVRFKPRFM